MKPQNYLLAEINKITVNDLYKMISIGMYTTTHQAHGSWNPYELQPPHKHELSQNSDYSPPHKVDVSQTLPQQSEIDLTGEEVPALR